MSSFTSKRQRDLEKLTIQELREIANEQNLTVKDATQYGNAMRKATWVKLLVQNPEPKSNQRKREAQQTQTISLSDYKPSKSSIQGLTRLPQIKTVTYSYGTKS